MNTEWNVTKLITQTERNVVKAVSYCVSATEGEHSASLNLVKWFDSEGDPFIPYSELTNEKVIEWVKGSLGENEVISIEANLSDQLEAKKNPAPQLENPSLPWNP